MRLRVAQFVQVPTWVMQHEAVHGNATRLAVYIAIRFAAWENPNHEWRSERELSVRLGEVVGIASETVRGHLRALKEAGVVGGDLRTLEVPSDGPLGGAVVGEPTNLVGVVPTTPSSLEKREIHTREEVFDLFWSVYPRKEARPNALKAWKALMKAKVDPQTIVEGAEEHARRWKLDRTEKRFIPLPSSWLNAHRFNDTPISTSPVAASQRQF